MIVLLNLFKIIKYYVIKLWTLAILNVFYSILLVEHIIILKNRQ